MTATGPCQARREQDEIVCARCRLRWDISDATPPECLPLVKSPPVATRCTGEDLANTFVSALAPDQFRSHRRTTR